MFIGHLYVFIGEVSAHFSGWVVCLSATELYELLIDFLEVSPLSVVSFTIIFSPSESCHFILFIVSFAVQKLLSFMRSSLFIFVFISIRRWVRENLAAIYVRGGVYYLSYAIF